MPTPREKLAMTWPVFRVEHGSMWYTFGSCPLCGAAVRDDNKQVHIDYHYKLLERFERLEGIEAILAKDK